MFPCARSTRGSSIRRQSSTVVRVASIVDVGIVVAEIVVLIIWSRRQHQPDGVRGEILELPPDCRPDMQAVIRAVEGNNLTIQAVVDLDVEAAGEGDDEFVKRAVGVAAAVLAGRHIVDPVNAQDRKRNVTQALDERQVSAVVLNLRQLDGAAVVDRHHVRSLRSPARTSPRRSMPYQSYTVARPP